ncbi:hypothetical protein [Gleimia coleocanis]|uniref:aldose epimerase family protein n=1 Tax=Gleimia coleocanis TaxID=103618 RepID=UPI0002F1C2E8|nr:hypothetical protein [Gleimia coleocanis]
MASITTLTCGSSRAQINHFGAQIFSWQVNGVEQFFLSDLADHDCRGPLRGGIPLCFPWFGGAAKPFHGFGRNNEWKLVESSDSQAVFTFEFDACDYPVVPEFLSAGRMRLTFTLTPVSLRLDAQIENLSDEAKPVELGLHGYFRANAGQAILHGVRGNYLDYASGEPVSAHTDTDLNPVPAGINRVYEGAFPAVLDGLQITPSGYTHTVVWNPGENPGIGDLPDFQALDFVCVEQLYRNPNAVLQPSEDLQLSVIFSVN